MPRSSKPTARSRSWKAGVTRVASRVICSTYSSITRSWSEIGADRKSRFSASTNASSSVTLRRNSAGGRRDRPLGHVVNGHAERHDAGAEQRLHWIVEQEEQQQHGDADEKADGGPGMPRHVKPRVAASQHEDASHGQRNERHGDENE